MNADEERLESIDLYPSAVSERMLMALGHILYSALNDAKRLDEVELLMGAIGEFTAMTSSYGEKTGRITESFGINLNEAAIFKQTYLKNSKPMSDTYYQFSEQFIAELKEAETWLLENPPD